MAILSRSDSMCNFQKTEAADIYQNLIHQPDVLPAGLNLNLEELSKVAKRLPMRLNTYFLSLIQSADDPLAKQVIPDIIELTDCRGPDDPLKEQAQSPVPGLIHRYPARVAFTVSNQCAVHCRFCLRKRNVFDGKQVSDKELELAIAYIRNHPQINEVILTGGDPLMLPDARIKQLLLQLRSIKHVLVLRIHTRIPSVFPERITKSLAHMLAKFHPLYLNIHFNHPNEITPAAENACRLLAEAGIALGSQTVLLKGINDQEQVLCKLFEKLLQIRVKPYYLHQLDRVRATAHFQVSMEKALSLITYLRGRLSGMAIPQLMVDLPAGGGKVAVSPESVVEKQPGRWVFRNWQGKLFSYP
ncbi:MAG: KamA family radical SAM protein [Desulfobacteraceae bacterium]|nr:KamA family radical SAM protein [Desulfobacteraceae bacterium]